MEREGNLKIANVTSNRANNVWPRKIKCKCGASIRRDKWYACADCKRPYGFKCYNHLNKQKKGEDLSTRELSFTIPFVDALKCLKKRDNMLRQNQYTEIKVKVIYQNTL